MNTYILGDVHGSIMPICNLRSLLPIGGSPLLILLGDVGLNYFLNQKDRKLKEAFSSLDFQYFIIRGNHEERPSNVMKKYPDQWHIEERYGGKVYVENDFPNIAYAMDTPSIYSIDNKKILVIPGAYSVDKQYRLQKGYNWFPDEQLNQQERLEGEALCDKQHFDVVLSHTCPLAYEPKDLFLPTIDQTTVDKTMEVWLNDLETKIDYELWVWGHYHDTRIYPASSKGQQIMLYYSKALDLNKWYQTMNPYESLVD